MMNINDGPSFIVFKSIQLGTYRSEVNDTIEFRADELVIPLPQQHGEERKITLKMADIKSVVVSVDVLPFHIAFAVRPKVIKDINTDIVPEGQGVFSLSAKNPEEKEFKIFLTHDLTPDEVLFIKDYFMSFPDISYNFVNHLKHSSPEVEPEPECQTDETMSQVVEKLNETVATNGNVKSEEQYVPPKKKSRKNSQLQENINLDGPRSMRTRRNAARGTLKDYNSDDEDYQSNLNKALAESLHSKSNNETSSDTTVAKPAQPLDRFPEFNNEIKLLTYAHMIITMEEYKSLDYRELLPDVVLDFMLKYIHEEKMPPELSKRVFVFNSQMYNDLAISTNFNGWKADGMKDIPAAKKRHERVKAYYEGVNIFEKDFLVVPCFDNGHWFLAIICYPALNGCVDANGDKWPIEAVFRHDQMNFKLLEPPIKKASSIIVFDSVKSNPSRRNTAINHLRNLLVTEFDEKFKDQNTFELERHNIRGASARCPQQSNVTDCGLFIMEFMEYFFIKKPIEDYTLPLELTEWFDPDDVFHKRHEISELMKEKMAEQNDAPIELPNIILYKELDPDFTVPVLDSSIQCDQNGNGNFDALLDDDNSNNNNNNNNDENGNNNESAFNNNNDFYEVDLNAVNANAPVNGQGAAVEQIAMVNPTAQVEAQPSSPAVSYAITDDDFLEDQVSRDSVIQESPPSPAKADKSADRSRTKFKGSDEGLSSTTVDTSGEVVNIDDDDEMLPQQSDVQASSTSDIDDQTMEETKSAQDTGDSQGAESLL